MEPSFTIQIRINHMWIHIIERIILFKALEEKMLLLPCLQVFNSLLVIFIGTHLTIGQNEVWMQMSQASGKSRLKPVLKTAINKLVQNGAYEQLVQNILTEGS